MKGSLLSQDWAFWTGVLLIAGSLAVVTYILVPVSDGGKKPRARRSLRSDVQQINPNLSPAERIVASLRSAATHIGSRAVERVQRMGAIDAALDRAGIIMRAGEFVAVVAGSSVVTAFVMYLLLGGTGIVVGMILPLFGAPAVIRFLARRRNAAFGDQLADTLVFMAGSLRSGFGLGTAIDTVGQEFDPPMGTEFQRAMLETRLGRDMEDALEAVATRVRNEDFQWVVDAMRIHRQVGGDLADILDQVSETIRGRVRLRRQIDSLTAEGRLSGIVLGALPIVMGFMLYSSNPDYVDPLLQETTGKVMLALAVVLLASGAFWLKKLISVDI